MKEYYYMFSSGSYSDYCVGGLYKSTEKLDEQYFAKYLKSHMIKQVPEAKEFFESLATEISVLTGCNLSENLYVYCTQDTLPVWNRSFKFGTQECSDYFHTALARSERKQTWLQGKQFSQDITGLLVKDGILEQIEYEEIWNG